MPSGKAKKRGGSFWRATCVAVVLIVTAFVSFLTAVMHLDQRGSTLPKWVEVEFFRIGSDGTKLLRSGWHAPESWGTWSRDSSAEIMWRLIRPPASELRIRIKGRIYPWYAAINQSVRVIVNGAHVATIERDFEGELSGGSFLVPASIALAKTPMRIVFEIANPTAPRDIGESSDTRKLGLGLINIEIEYGFN
jgi:hypothetical protein